MEQIIEVALALAIINATITVFILRSASLQRNQKLAQCSIVWLVPVLGAIVFAMLLSSSREPPHRHVRHARNEEDYPGVNLYPPHGPSD